MVQGAIPANRLLCLTRPAESDDSKIYIRLANEKERPDFFSTRDLEDGEEITINIKGSQTWAAEAAEDIPAGISLSTSADGKVSKMIAGDTETESYIGYSLHAVKAGERVQFVRNYKISNQWIDEVNAGVGGPVNWADVQGKPTSFPPATHNHNDLYYTKDESDDKYQPKDSGTE